jgi:hypothetical protein
MSIKLIAIAKIEIISQMAKFFFKKLRFLSELTLKFCVDSIFNERSWSGQGYLQVAVTCI